MRRSVREAIVGFSLLAAVTGAAGFSLWLRGLSLTRQFWTVEATFSQAGGLAARSPVVFRGVMVGSVRSVRVTPEAVVAELEITNPSLKLALPAKAVVGQGSLLGGEAQVALISTGKPMEATAPSPRAPGCPRSRMLCNGSRIEGSEQPTLGSVISQMEQLLKQGEKEQLVQKFAGVATSVDRTSKDAAAFLQEGRALVGSLDQSVQEARPAIANIRASSAHLRRLIAALENPKTVAQLQQTVTNAEQLTARWDAVGGDVNKLTADPRFMDGLRSVAVGLGEFFEELYPAQTAAARDKAKRERDAQEKGSAAEAGKPADQGTTPADQNPRRQARPHGKAPEAYPIPSTP
ncbi:MlaD family protein [Cyanobium sp. NIES-981]|uniref:MlaD family protein n=1 Tax=Cyanobium sp. NIES-981 TaxID=1851505 RepID=UPI0007DDA39E|nr:MlaD family protein [Cyanobium sp. NIES-981]SBO43731.1 ABC-type transport system involved in resistance to organic solvents periplasmic component [Cyanobium sp. NIES-981]